MGQRLGEGEKAIERREGARGYDVLRLLSDGFYSLVDDLDIHLQQPRRFPQKRRLPGICLDQSELRRPSLGRGDRGADKAGKACTRAKIEPAARLGWGERNELSAVENVSLPEIVAGLSPGEKIDAAVPVPEKVHEFPEPRLGFTWNKIVRPGRYHAASARATRRTCASSSVSAAGVIPSMRDA